MKVPRVPVADNAMTGEQPTYRDLWLRIRDDLPKKGRKARRPSSGEPKLPAELEGALQALYGNYEKAFTPLGRERRRRKAPRRARRRCSSSSATTPTSRRWSSTTSPAGTKTLADGTTGRRARRSCRSSATSKDGGWSPRPNTILVDSEQLESGEAMSAEFKRIAAVEIEEFKAEYRAALPRPRRGRADRRRPAARGDEHRRQAGQARRARAMRRVGLDAHRGLGRQHRDPHPRRPRLRHAAPLRAGRRPRACGG